MRKLKKAFQYISCSYSSDLRIQRRRSTVISIHLMFLFILHLELPPRIFYWHFNTSHGLIHPFGLPATTIYGIFQYISCSYSSASLISIYPSNSCISIHLMFLFIHRHGREPETIQTFQYISCSYSSINRCARLRLRKDFNTSHVLIHPHFANQTDCLHNNFNTSHVLIHRSNVNEPDGGAAFQYISCSYSSILKVYDFTVFEHFNTSHVSINPTLLSAFPFLLYLKFLENTSFFKFFPSVSQT